MTVNRLGKGKLGTAAGELYRGMVREQNRCPPGTNERNVILPVASGWATEEEKGMKIVTIKRHERLFSTGDIDGAQIS